MPLTPARDLVFPGVYSNWSPPPESILPLAGELGHALPHEGLPRGMVIELAATNGVSKSASLALRACAASQRESYSRGGDVNWCAWIDATHTLSAPAAESGGACLERLLVIRPSLDVLPKVALKILESGVFSMVVIDVAAFPFATPRVSLHPWAAIVRRLSLCIEKSETIVLLLTRLETHRALVLPVGMRIELEQPSFSTVGLRVAKHRGGLVRPLQNFTWKDSPGTLHPALSKLQGSRSLLQARDSTGGSLSAAEAS